MTKKFRIYLAAALVCSLVSAAGLAQNSAEATYKAKCQMCHGAKGMADTPAAKSMKVVPATDPAVKSMSEPTMVNVVTNGKGKMPAYKGKLSDAEIKELVAYYRTFSK